MSNAQLECDRFGPWVLEISEMDPPPPLFLPHLTRSDTPLLSIKVPRRIEQRRAQPGMNLYDYMVMLYEHDLLVLQRVGEDEVAAQTFAYRDMKWLCLGKNLLAGNLHLGLRGQAYDLRFNSVSYDLMSRVVNLIRRRYMSAETPAVRVTRAALPEEKLSFRFASLLHQEQEKDPPQWLLLAAQPETSLAPVYASVRLRDLIFGLLDKRLLESLHFCNGRELKIYSRGKLFRYRGQAVYAVDTTYVPLDAISGVTLVPDGPAAAVANLVLQTAGGDITYAFMADNPALEDYAQFLRVGGRG